MQRLNWRERLLSALLIVILLPFVFAGFVMLADVAEQIADRYCILRRCW